MQQLVSERLSEQHSCIRPCASYVAGSFDEEDNNLTCHVRENGAPEKYAFPSRVKYFISHVTHAKGE